MDGQFWKRTLKKRLKFVDALFGEISRKMQKFVILQFNRKCAEKRE